ncbi:flagellar type III secretion system protein FlhB [Sphingomonas nostoxanthinifaciens]|uniref:flagellar type III secretion system protein FlhB n=1 Tax=Sphingomonas nostoxanthinifaciens TaxID=2872652 RepID=UPI001CC20663|nr:flagellar type III secretion system protein FlhB [Sphingomonas nostoxanthinifaciens]UAK22975.1 flagellar type III secretion system protein FlhB [Sphingomonas nostoxanthinifaciens]
MADTPDRDEKTEAPTAKRRNDAVEQGDVLQSRELGTALVILAGAAWIALAGPWMVGSCEQMLRRGLTFDSGDIVGFDPLRAFLALLLPVLLPLATLFGLTLVAAIGTPAMLGSLGFRWSALGFKAEKINPLTGMKRVFGVQGLIELGKGLAKVLVLGLVAWWLLRSRMPSIMGLGRQDFVSAIGSIGHGFSSAILVMALALALIAGFDLPAQIIQRAGRLRMTKQEVKDEHKQTEGSPDVKMALRRKQHQLLSGGARKAMAQASVVLTNPTHFAVALQYRPGFDSAPIVVAKGRGATAAAIRELADAHAVPILSYPQLARAIYFTSREGMLIRDDLYIAVATVLAFVFNLDRAMADGVVQPQIDVPEAARFDENGNATRS